ncbi:MAG: arginase, partial [Tissierellales bacterium]
GVDMGPSAIRYAGVVERLERIGHSVTDLGDITIAPPEKEVSKNHNLKNLEGVVQASLELSKQVDSIISEKQFPLIFGGDHSIAIGTLAGVSKHFNNLGVIWYDAHGDLNTEETSPSGNIHGMPLAASLGYGHPSLTNIGEYAPKVKPENTFLVGVRDLDEGEIELANRIDLNLYTMETIRSRGLDSIIEDITTKIKNSNLDAVHLSFDIDVLDKKLVPGTGTPVDGGFTIEEVKTLFKSFIDTKLIRSMDFVELNPLLDENDSTADLCIEIIDWIFKHI